MAPARSTAIVFCGTAAGSVSAARGAYYAHPQNKFWRILYDVRLTPRLLRPEEYLELPRWGLGLTDIAKNVSGMDRELPRGALVLSLFGVRPGVLDAESNPMADLLAAFGGAMLTNATAYNQAQRTASQLKDAVVARSVVDQAKGILMHALGCDADEALRRLRQESQRRHVKVTEVATEVVAAYGSEEPKTSGPGE